MVMKEDNRFPIEIIRVVDGDGFSARALDGSNRQLEVRLFAIDAPEGRQKFGRESTDHLRNLTKDGRFWMEVKDDDPNGRAIAVVYKDSLDLKNTLNYAMVRDGWAYWYSRYERERTKTPDGDLVITEPRNELGLKEAEAQAYMESKGVWVEPNLERPWDYKARVRVEDDEWNDRIASLVNSFSLGVEQGMGKMKDMLTTPEEITEMERRLAKVLTGYRTTEVIERELLARKAKFVEEENTTNISQGGVGIDDRLIHILRFHNAITPNSLPRNLYILFDMNWKGISKFFRRSKISIEIGVEQWRFLGLDADDMAVYCVVLKKLSKSETIKLNKLLDAASPAQPHGRLGLGRGYNMYLSNEARIDKEKDNLRLQNADKSLLLSEQESAEIVAKVMSGKLDMGKDFDRFYWEERGYQEDIELWSWLHEFNQETNAPGKYWRFAFPCEIESESLPDQWIFRMPARPTLLTRERSNFWSGEVAYFARLGSWQDVGDKGEDGFFYQSCLLNSEPYRTMTSIVAKDWDLVRRTGAVSRGGLKITAYSEDDFEIIGFGESYSAKQGDGLITVNGMWHRCRKEQIVAVINDFKDFKFLQA